MDSELNKRLAEWAGWHSFNENGCGYPPNNIPKQPRLYPIFTQSLDACFKWLVPKLRIGGEYPYLKEIILDIAMCDVEMYYCYLRYDSLHDDGFVEREEVQASAENPALALCKAIDKLIDSEKKDD